GSETRISAEDCVLPDRALRYRLPDHLGEDLAYLLGLLVGDGCFTQQSGFVMTTRDEFIAVEFCRIVRELFGYSVASRDGSHYPVNSRHIRAFLASLGLGCERAHEKHVPRAVLRAPRHIAGAFLQGLFDTDGYADKRYGNVQLSTASPRLAREVQLLLLNMGLVASLHVQQPRR